MELTVIGIDCATEASNIGIALASTKNGQTEVADVQIGGRTMLEKLLNWIDEAGPVLLALDAPLGWPMAMGEELPNHRAGCRISVARNEMFRRITDRIIDDEVGKRPLEVGANLIARTSHAALRLLSVLRRCSGEELPLVWEPGQVKTSSSAIEVYPAATLKAHGIEVGGYKQTGDFNERLKILNQVSRLIELPDIGPVAASADTVDAVLCVLAAHDFLYDEVIEPKNLSTAAKEGWIWVKKPTA